MSVWAIGTGKVAYQVVALEEQSWIILVFILVYHELICVAFLAFGLLFISHVTNTTVKRV